MSAQLELELDAKPPAWITGPAPEVKVEQRGGTFIVVSGGVDVAGDEDELEARRLADEHRRALADLREGW
jgi:hypothetical protein